MGWAVCINFVMLACLSIGVKLSPYHLAVLGVLAVAITYADMKYILPREQEYYFARNPEWQRFRK